MCKEEAVPGGKRYCKKHKAEYLQKRAEYLKRAEVAPKCGHCGAPIFIPNQPKEGLCKICHAQEEQRIKQQLRERTKAIQLSEAKTVEELKEWIYKYAY